ncbi:glycosyltransferase [Brevibacterium sp. BDJS002]|uniref:D-inositol 3-phosphate glycosyltransferase n=1 Tax=Brevibacterium aurantiacum TaxID=273384 RepID=A0A4Z0KNN2_BREAU|nr:MULTISPECIES: glycosyltransferase [Brevibacterium]MDN5551510.1 glycosyltransferase [Brevibacterium sp.]MDN5710758.1 glycosyltransferase [Brevibacterium aurantiacum]MDN5737906.1 glycosyltransferase [Brevibacterium aurantiacum]TGD39721.1 glycosyltransferase family 4 protein [Brevibacterium aurantiacum]WCE42001.1 glycosyltransferase [Brevibacterium sp. BDJS002]
MLIPTETYAPEVNGAAKFAERLAAGLAARGNDVHVACPSATGKASVSTEDGVTVHRMTSHRWLLHPTWTICMPWETKPELSRLLDTLQPDVVHTQAHFVIGRYAFSEASRRGIPVVATNHFMPDNVRPYLRAPKSLLDGGTAVAWWDLRRKFQSADFITVPTQLAADLLTQNGFTSPIRAVSCGIDLERFAHLRDDEAVQPATVPDPVSGSAPPRVLFVGRLSSEKHAADIVEALAKTDPALGLEADIVGGGDQEEPLKELAAELGIADRVHVLGKISDKELMDAYQRCTFFCMPSTAELQSIATLEALASRKPVVLADAVALPHLVRDGINGFLFPPRDIEELASRFTQICELSEDDLDTMARASLDVVAKHDIEYTLDTFESIYSKVIDENIVSAA